jgi:V/A-type H+-transporting ATPase subunit E
MSKAATDTLQKVSDEFEAEVVSDLQAGRDQAMQNVQAARKQTSEAVAKTVEGGERQAEAVKRQIIGAAELEVRNAQLKSLETAVNEVFDSAVRRVSSLSDSAMEGSLTALIREGIDVIGPRAIVHCSAKQRKAVSTAVRKLNRGPVKLIIDEKEIESIGGVILAAPNGSVKFDNTFEARLERMRPALRKEVAGILTGS